jgi:hypothetical protein
VRLIAPASVLKKTLSDVYGKFFQFKVSVFKSCFVSMTADLRHC